MSLGDFVKNLTALLKEKNVEMPFKNQRPWHLLFYDLKEDQRAGKPDFFQHLQFDWNGPHPKSQELTEFLQALHWNASVSVGNPHYNTISLPDDIAQLWRQGADELDPATEEFLQFAVERARNEFQREAQ
jgi:hypothetical protein